MEVLAAFLRLGHGPEVSSGQHPSVEACVTPKLISIVEISLYPKSAAS